MIAARITTVLAAIVGSLAFGTPPSAYSSELEDAVQSGNLEQVERLIEQDPALVNPRPDGDSGGEEVPPLHLAAYENHFEIAQFLLKNGADVNLYIKNDKATPIMAAMNAKMAKLLIAHGADIDVRGHHSHKTPLQAAADWGNVELAKVLIGAGAELDIESAVKLGRTEAVVAMLEKKPWLAKAPRRPLHSAAGNGDIEMVELLLKHGADPNFDVGSEYFSNQYTALSAAVQDDRFETAKLLCERGADTNVNAVIVHSVVNLLHFAVGERDIEFVRLLLDHGARVDVRDDDSMFPMGGGSPLHLAADMVRRLDDDDSDATRRAIIEKVKLLIDRGADVDARTSAGATPLLLAAFARADRVCDLLLARGARLDFHAACALGKHAAVKSMLKSDPSLARPNGENGPRSHCALHWAVLSGAKALVETLLAHGADPNAVAPASLSSKNGSSWYSLERVFPGAGSTPLHVAAAEGHSEIARSLMARGADVNAKNADGETALHLAAEQGHEDVVDALIGARAKLDAKDEARSTPLHLAAKHGHEAVVDALVGARAKLDAKDEARSTPLHLAAGGGHAKVVNRLLASGAELEPRTKRGYTPLHAGIGNSEVAKLLLDAGAEIDAVVGTAEGVERPVEKGGNRYRLDAKNTPLRLTTAGNKDVVDLLIARGARIDLLTACTFGMTDAVEAILKENPKRRDVGVERRTSLRPIDLAAQHGQLELIRRLLTMGAKLQSDDDGFFMSYPLHLAARHGHREVVALLLDQGLKVDFEDHRGETPLHASARGAQPELVRFLLSRGANVSATRDDGRTPLHEWANSWLGGSEQGNDQADFVRRRRTTAKLLIDAGADVNAKSDNGQAPLHDAVQHGATEVAEVLLANGAEVNRRTNRNETPLELVAGRDPWIESDRVRKRVIELLRQHGGVR